MTLGTVNTIGYVAGSTVSAVGLIDYDNFDSEPPLTKESESNYLT